MRLLATDQNTIDVAVRGALANKTPLEGSDPISTMENSQSLGSRSTNLDHLATKEVNQLRSQVLDLTYLVSSLAKGANTKSCNAVCSE